MYEDDRLEEHDVPRLLPLLVGNPVEVRGHMWYFSVSAVSPPPVIVGHKLVERHVSRVLGGPLRVVEAMVVPTLARLLVSRVLRASPGICFKKKGNMTLGSRSERVSIAGEEML